MKETTSEGKDVQQAVEKGLAQLGLRRDQVEVAILDEGSAGFLGLGARPARVTLSEKRWEGGHPPPPSSPRPPGVERRREPRPERRPAPRSEARPEGATATASAPAPASERREEPKAPADVQAAAQLAQTVVSEMLSLAGLSVAHISSAWDDAQSRVNVEVESEDSKHLIGRDGRGLEALQFLATIVASRRHKSPIAVHVDTGGYLKKREEELLQQVTEAADRVKRTGRVFRLEPMDARLRRLVHKSLANNPDVETASEGEGPWRKVVLKPRRR